MECRISFSNNWQDYRQLVLNPLLLVGAVLLLISSYLIVVSGEDWRRFSMLPFIFALPLAFVLLKYYCGRPKWTRSRTLVARSDGLEEAWDNGQRKLQWSDIERIERTSSYISIRMKLDDESPITIPRRAFQSDKDFEATYNTILAFSRTCGGGAI